MGDELVPWTRYWVPLGGSIDCGWQCNWFFKPSETTSVETVKLLSRSRLLVLVGSPGMGKSIELNTLATELKTAGDVDGNVLRFRATKLGPTPGLTIQATEEWQSHKNSGSKLALLVDGIDEALPYNPGLLDALAGFIERSYCTELRVILGLRSGAWDGRNHSEMFQEWETSEALSVYEICPIRYEDVELAFRQENYGNLESFIRWIENADLGVLARTPIHLNQLIENWRADPEQRMSLHQMRDQQITRLLRDDPRRRSRPGRPPATPDWKLQALAELIGVHAVLTGRLRFLFGEVATGDSTSLDLLGFLDSPVAAVWKSPGDSFEFSEAILRELMDQALFTRVSGIGEPPAYAFTHHSLAERLAGRALGRQPLSRLLRVLGAGHRKKIVPQMEALAAMLAPSNSALTDWLLQNQPDVLLRSDGTGFQPNFRSRIVTNVLTEIETSDENRKLEWSQIDSGFACPEVGAVLIASFENRDSRTLTRMAALLIAARCPDRVAEIPLWNLIDDSSKPTYMRTKALDAWIAHVRREPEKNRVALWRIAKGEAGTGKSHDRADALRVLLESGEPARNILRYLPEPDDNMIGSLHLLRDYELPKQITVEDIPACLEHINQNGPRPYSRLADDNLASAVYRLIFRNLEVIVVLEAFADHWWIVDEHYHAHLVHELRPMIDVLSSDQRHQLVEALIKSNKLANRGFEWRLPVDPNDFEWIVSSLPATGHIDRPLWLSLVSWMWLGATKNGMDDFLVAAYVVQSDDFKAIFPTPLRGRDIKETVARFHRSAILKNKRQDAGLFKSLPPREKGLSRIDSANLVESEFRSNPITGWIHFARYAWAKFADDGAQDWRREGGVQESPGWLALSEIGQDEALAAARTFLETETPGIETDGWTWVQEAGYLAVDLLSNLVERDIVLGNFVKNRWLETVVNQFRHSKLRHQELVKIMKNLAPERVRAMMIAKTEECLITSEVQWRLQNFKISWDIHFSHSLSEMLISHLIGSGRRRILDLRAKMPSTVARHAHQLDEKRARRYARVFNFMADTEAPQARHLLSSLSLAPIGMRIRPHPALPLILLHGIIKFPDIWKPAWDSLYSYGRHILETVFNNFISDLDRLAHKNDWSSLLDAVLLSRIYSAFDEVFPRMFDTEFRSGTVTLEDQQRDFEEKIAKRLANLGASGEIECLIHTLNCEKRRELLRWYLGEARSNSDKESWTTPSTDEISRWLLTEDSVLVRNSDDLKEAVVVSLERYQNAIALDGRHVRDCWDRQVGQKATYVPFQEEELSSRITDHLLDDLKRVIVIREGELRLGVRKGRTDISVSTIASGKSVTVIVEHKRAQNSEVNTGMRDQLVERYLKPSNCSCGIYLVSWFDGFAHAATPVRNRLDVKSPSEALEKLRAQAKECSAETGYRVDAFLLNCTSPDMTRLPVHS